MSKTIGNKLTIILMMMVGALMIQPSVSAESLPPGMVIGDSEGISVDGTGAYYVEKEDILPGDQFVKVIKLMNTEKNDRPYLLEMSIAPKEKEGTIDFYEAIQVTMKLEGKIVYEGNLVGIGSPDLQKERLNLGTYGYGEFAELEVTFKVSDKLPVTDWHTKSYAIIKWNFYATKPDLPTKPKPKPPSFLPQTGEEWRALIYKIITGIFIVCVVLLVARKRKNREY